MFEKDQILERTSEYVGDLFADNRPPLPAPKNNEGPPILKSEVCNALKISQNAVWMQLTVRLLLCIVNLHYRHLFSDK